MAPKECTSTLTLRATLTKKLSEIAADKLPALNARWDSDGLNDSATTYNGDNHWQDDEENQMRPSFFQTTVILGSWQCRHQENTGGEGPGGAMQR